MAEDSHPIIPLLTPLFEEITSTDAKIRDSGLNRLLLFIAEEGDIRFHRSHQLNAQSQALPLFIRNSLQKLFSSKEQGTRLAAVRIVEALLSVDYCDLTTRTAQLSALLLDAVSDNGPVSVAAVKVWGLLLTNGSGLVGDLVNDQIKRALLLLKSDSNKCYVGCLILSQLAEKVPGNVLAFLDEAFSRLVDPLKDPSESTREGAGATLRCLLAIAPRDSGGSEIPASPTTPATTTEEGKVRKNLLQEVVNNLLVTATEYFAHRQGAVQHGGWIIFNAILEVCCGVSTAAERSTIVGSGGFLGSAMGNSAAVVSEMYSPPVLNKDVMSKAWNHATTLIHKMPSAPDIKRELYIAIPLMAKYDKPLFMATCMQEVLRNAFRSTSVEEKNATFVMIGCLGEQLSDSIGAYIDTLMHFIDANLYNCKKPKRERCSGAVACLARLAKADPAVVRPYVSPRLKAIFAGAPTVEFAQNIASLCNSFPELQSNCLGLMLELIQRQLDSVPFRTRTSTSATDVANTSVLAQSFQALSVLDFRGYSTLAFLSHNVAPRFWDPEQSVRRWAAEICTRMLLCGCDAPGSPCKVDSEGVMIHQGAAHIKLILDLQQQLLAVAIADPESDIRLATIEMLGEKFDHTLSMQDCIRSIFPALNDKHQNRAAAVKLLGRLSKRNPACVFPMLRKIMVQCITEIEYLSDIHGHQVTVDERKLEQATIILGAIVEAAPDLVQPYRIPLLESAAKRLKRADSGTMVLAALLSCVGKLVRHISDRDLHLVKELKPIVVDHLMDGTSTAKKQEAMRALACIVRATREVNLYDEFPKLLPMLLSMLHGGFKESWPVRRDVLSLMGAIGAVDPVKVKGYLRAVKEGSEGTNGVFRARKDDLAHTVVATILNVLQIPSNNDATNSHAAQALVDIFVRGCIKMSDAISYIPKIVPELCRHIQKEPRQRAKFFKQLVSLVSYFKYHIRSHLDEIFDTLKQHINGDDPAVLEQAIVLLEELRGCLNEEFKPFLPSLLPLLVGAVQLDSGHEKPRTVELVLRCFNKLGKLLDGHLHVVLPAVIEIASKPSIDQQCRIEALVTIQDFAKHLSSMADHAARCIHCIIRVFSENLPPSKDAHGRLRPHSLRIQCVQALESIAQNLGDGFTKFMPMVLPVIEMLAKEEPTRYKELVETIAQTHGRPSIIYPEPPLQRDHVPSDHGVGQQSPPRPDRFDSIMRHLQTVNSRKEEGEMKLWLWQFAKCLLRASSSPALQMCVVLAQEHEPFARSLLHPAFVSCYNEMTSDMKISAVDQLKKALTNKHVSSEVLQELLNLAEYMERVEEFTPKRGKGAETFTSLFDIKVLAERSENCNLHAKTIHYLEASFMKLTHAFQKSLITGKQIEPLQRKDWEDIINVCGRTINLCNLLGQRETADGVLKFIQRHFEMFTGGQQFTILDVRMYEKLQWWSQSLAVYRENQRKEPNDIENIVGVMTSLDALGDFPRLLTFYNKIAQRGHRKAVTATSIMGARAAWLLQSWDDMKAATASMPREGYAGTTATFYRAVLAIHNNDLQEGLRNIAECRRKLDTDISALVAESYDRAYRHIVGLQQLAELEEVAQLKRDRSLLPAWRELWSRRLQNMAQDPSEWQGTLANHALVLVPQEELPLWIQFVALCRAKERGMMAQEVLYKLLGGKSVEDVLLSPNNGPNPLVAIAALTDMYEVGRKEEALRLIKGYMNNAQLRGYPTEAAMCRVKLSEWLIHENPKYVSDMP